MLELVQNVFYFEILPEMMKNGRVQIDEDIYSICFGLNIHGKLFKNPHTDLTFLISSKELFDEALCDYAKEMILWMKRFSFDSDKVWESDSLKIQLKALLTLVFANMTTNDFLDPVGYLKRRTAFLKDSSFSFDKKLLMKDSPEFFSSDLWMQKEAIPPFLETPYRMNFWFSKNEERMMLPSVYYGIEEDTCVIYAIQQKGEIVTSYQKKLNRIFYKVNKDVHPSFDEKFLLQVTPSFLISLTLFLKLLREEGIAKVEVVLYMPVREESRTSSFTSVLSRYEGLLKDSLQDSYEKNQENLLLNTTNKLAYTFFRLEKQLSSLEVVSYPYEGDSCLHVSLKEPELRRDDLLNSLDFDDFLKKGKKL